MSTHGPVARLCPTLRERVLPLPNSLTALQQRGGMRMQSQVQHMAVSAMMHPYRRSFIVPEPLNVPAARYRNGHMSIATHLFRPGPANCTVISLDTTIPFSRNRSILVLDLLRVEALTGIRNGWVGPFPVSARTVKERSDAP